MLIDLSQLNGVMVNAEARTATAQPAIRDTEVMAALARHGTCFPSETLSNSCSQGLCPLWRPILKPRRLGPSKNVITIDLVNGEDAS